MSNASSALEYQYYKDRSHAEDKSNLFLLLNPKHNKNNNLVNI
jgi:hypothetical protein